MNGDKTDTVYNERCELPDSISRGTQQAKFQYDGKCHVTKKETGDEVTNLTYDAGAGKVSYVERLAKKGSGKPQMEIWAKYHYDANGNLDSAQNSEKKTVNLSYDRNGRIKLLLDQTKRKIIFDYNNLSKPEKITIPGLGVITVDYTNSGAVKKVNNPGGEKVPQEVTAAFENLADIINPAGVTLSL